MTAPAAARPAEARRGTRRQGRSSQRSSQRSIEGGYDRVGGSRLTGLGAGLVFCAIAVVSSPPDFADRQTIVLVWSALVAAVVLGAVWPMVAVRRITITATSPRDAVVGERLPIPVTVGGRLGSCSIRALDPTSDWYRVSRAGTGDLEHLADRRGVFGLLRLEIRVTAPLGVVAAHRVHDVVLPIAVEVAPRALAVDWQAGTAPVELGSGPSAAAVGAGEVVRSVRPYVTGDPAHLVHWPTSARTGGLVVRELEAPTPTGQAIVLDLRDLGTDAERAAAYALGAARAVLAEGVLSCAR
ncbi:MAG: DUF58 domain-containing protein [Candidatus Eremiobacteraeota bacterium]|nr:DUF58 domain-containing protein [Candidatus Eremiobacteraeota bacterium]